MFSIDTSGIHDDLPGKAEVYARWGRSGRTADEWGRHEYEPWWAFGSTLLQNQTMKNTKALGRACSLGMTKSVSSFDSSNPLELACKEAEESSIIHP
jgi:hypothetical protein